MNNKVLGNIALIGAPCLGLGFFIEAQVPQLRETWFTGLWGLVYMTGWMCSLLVIQRERLTGESKFGRIILWVIFASLLIANYSNVLHFFYKKEMPAHFFYVDMFWPISNTLMLIVGITVVVAKKLSGWKRFVPLFAGCWFPCLFIIILISGKTTFLSIFAATHSVVAFSLLAMVVRKLGNKERYLAVTSSNFVMG